ncbi:MAG: bifunctional DNA-formamidopyrimidine glycosylase/DNA-(apurinic or apyrimidinic site) lyase [Planctomycetes bacterium]|nr:bifunctional DNA-formamidopyrimidine glycosylase/DNA-(apurinic or apyrimidinic site) lyase [Planctomycetota bacterium]
MPELPEVETVTRGLAKHLIGLKIKDVVVNLPKIVNLKPALFRKAVAGRKVTAVKRRAKVIIISLDTGFYSLAVPPRKAGRNTANYSTNPDGFSEREPGTSSRLQSHPVRGGASNGASRHPNYLVVHLKMSGQLLYLKSSEPVRKHTHVTFTLDNGHHLRFWDQRQFGYVRLFGRNGLDNFISEHKFGPEPLDNFTPEQFKGLLKTRPNNRIKPLLMDQTFIAGIGNLYADEILFYARVHPLRKPASFKTSEVKDIYAGMQKILRKAIKERGSSVELYVDAEGRPGNYVKYIKAYDREDKPCLRCGTKIKRIKIGSRSAYFCPRCQK